MLCFETIVVNTLQVHINVVVGMHQIDYTSKMRKFAIFFPGFVYIMPDSYRRSATLVSDNSAVCFPPELSDARRSTNRWENHFA